MAKCTVPKFSRKMFLLPIVGLTAFFLYILLFGVDVVDIATRASTANPFIYGAAVVVSLVEVFFYAVSWQNILSYLQVKISLMRSYLYVWYSTFLDIVIPAESISGELCRVYLVNRELSGSSGKVIASVVAQRILGMAMNVVFLVLGIVLLFSTTGIDPNVFYLIIILTFAIAVIMVALLVLSSKKKWITKAIAVLFGAAEYVTRGKWKRLAQIRQETFKEASNFHNSMRELIRKPQMLFLPSLFLAANWLCSLFVIYIVYLSLDYQISWSVVLVTNSIITAIKSVPIGIPFEVGIPEMAMMSLYSGMSVPAELSATATILIRIITLWLRFGIGFASQQWVEFKSVVYSRSRKAAPEKENSASAENSSEAKS